MALFEWQQTRKIKARGFRDGSQNVSTDKSEKEIGARLDQEAEQGRHDAASRIRSIEASVDTFTLRKTDTEQHWRELETQTNRMPPPIALPLLAVSLALAAVGGEAVLLAPVMDGFGIARLEYQYFTAAVLILASSGLLEIAIQQILQRHKPSQGKADVASQVAEEATRYERVAGWIALSLSIFAFSFIAVLGWWRAAEMIFAGSQQGDTKSGAFLNQNAGLTRLCVTLLTIGLPVFAAIAAKWGLDGLRLAWVWRVARRQFRSFSSSLNTFTKKIEAEREQTEFRIATLEKKKEVWLNIYLQSHELGKEVGAQQVPLWQVKFKIAAFVLLLIALCFLIDPALADYIKPIALRILIYSFATPGFGGVYAHHAVKAWDRPTPEQLYEQQATNWRKEPDSDVAAQELAN